jgi:hypothetical protein
MPGWGTCERRASRLFEQRYHDNPLMGISIGRSRGVYAPDSANSTSNLLFLGRAKSWSDRPAGVGSDLTWIQDWFPRPKGWISLLDLSPPGHLESRGQIGFPMNMDATPR